MSAPALRLVHGRARTRSMARRRWLEWLTSISIESGGRANGTRCCGCSPAISTTSGPLPGGAARRAARRRRTARPAAVTPVGGTWLRAAQ